MSFYNCGAFGPNGSRIKSKKQLKELLKADPKGVYFDGTGLFDATSGYRGHEIPVGLKLSVVGPDPYSQRNWYASIERRDNGTYKVA
jgi:hypothetical protein